jgi:hypothetical protein
MGEEVSRGPGGDAHLLGEFGQIEIRLQRPLLDTERKGIVERLREVGPDRRGEVTLVLSAEELSRWLADRTAR